VSFYRQPNQTPSTGEIYVMRRSESAERVRISVVDYSAARAKAIEWLGDRYLLAKPINRGVKRRDCVPTRASDPQTNRY
jgi:hypothetical protein